MKTFVKIMLAATIVLVAGLWFSNSFKALNNQADALEQPTEVIEQPIIEKTKIEPVKKTPFSETIVVETAIKFEAPLYWAVNDYGLIDGYSSTEELIEKYYLEFTEEQLARLFTEDFFYNEADGVHVTASASPNLIQTDRDFTITELNENQYQVSQVLYTLDDGETAYIFVDYIYDEVNNNWNIAMINYQY
ncbi:hypothetical protein [Viridibacillus arvi]|uniref:hypothetical protein n=1 Tax=Viridibacillus arvi TaxID=263475 RepID=UPI0034CDDAA9